MAFSESALVLWTPVLPRSCRLFLVVLLVRMWRLYACERLMLPPPRTRKRFFAPLLVFIFGMMLDLSICCPRRCSPVERLSAPFASAPDRLRACSGDAALLPLSSGPAASPFAGPPTAETVRRLHAARGRRGCAPANGCRIPGAPSRGRGNATLPWPCRLRPGTGSGSG